MWLSAITAGVGAAIAGMPLLQEFIDPKVFGQTMMVLGISFGILRAVTTQSLKDK